MDENRDFKNYFKYVRSSRIEPETSLYEGCWKINNESEAREILNGVRLVKKQKKKWKINKMNVGVRIRSWVPKPRCLRQNKEKKERKCRCENSISGSLAENSK